MTPSTDYPTAFKALMKRLEEEQLEVSRQNSELAQLREPAKMKESYEKRLKEKNEALVQKDKDIREKDEALIQKDKDMKEMGDTIQRQKETIESQASYIEWLKRKVFGSMSEKHDYNAPGQLTFDFPEMEVTQEEEEACQEAEKEVEAFHQHRKEAAKRRKAANKPSRNQLPENLRREVVHIYPDGYNEEEWELLGEAFDEVSEILMHKPEEYYVEHRVRHKAVRRNAKERVIECPPVPACPIARSYASASLLAHLIEGKYLNHIPFYRQIEMMKRAGVSIPPATVNDWFLDVADLLRPLYYRIRDLVLESGYIQSDETTVPVMRKGTHNTVKGYLWQVRAVMNNLLFFHYDKGSRSKDVALALFAHFSGAMQTDGYAVYDIYEKKSGVITLVCWAHARRYAERALNNDRERATFMLNKIGMLYEIERMADEQGLDYDGREELRMRLAVPILTAFEAWLKKEKPKVLPKSPIGKAINFILERFDRLCRYCADGRFLIDNNLIENGQRPVALGRKNFLFCGNDDAAEDAAVVYTMMGCCKAVGADFRRWLIYFLEHVHEYDNDYSRPLDELLPATLKDKGIC